MVCWPCANMSRESAVHHTISFASFELFGILYQLTSVWCWSMHSCRAGLIIVTACSLELVRNWWTGFSLSCARRLVWFWESESLIQSRSTYANVYTGFPFVRESSTSSDYWSTSVCMVWLHRICPTCLHWSVPIHTVVACDLLLMVIWLFPGHERCEWVLVVSLSPDQNFGTPWHRN